LLAVALISGCQSINSSKDLGLQPSDNPVTVDNVTRNDRLAQLGAQQHPRILATYGGEYKDQKLERMVAKIVGKLTTVTDKPDQTYRITILDSPNINAFALPGGYLYVTRGLLALANDSSEVAAVIAHEMGHVIANHGILRQEKEAETAIAGRVASEVLHNESASREEELRGKLRLAQFSRNQELQADAIGIKMIGEAGYDPFASARFLQSMEAYQSSTFSQATRQRHSASSLRLAMHAASAHRVSARPIAIPSSTALMVFFTATRPVRVMSANRPSSTRSSASPSARRMVSASTIQPMRSWPAAPAKWPSVSMAHLFQRARI